MSQKKVIRFIFILVLGLPIVSCTSYKKVPYLQTDGEVLNLMTNQSSAVLRYQPDDVLGITVNSSGEPSVAADFNLPVQPIATNESSSESAIDQGHGRQSYKVSRQGEIDFPVLGRVKVEGYSQEELEDKLKQTLRKYLKSDPVVTIRLMNYRVSILGEVNRPGQYSVSNDRINLLEALSLAGDMSIYGRRENVRLVRTESTGEAKMIVLDLTNPEIIKSPYFFLKQNDVLYIEPNSTKAKSSGIGAETMLLVSLGSLLLTVVNLMVLISK